MIQSERISGKRIGIMGGTFDPIHNGHLILGEYAYEQFQLDHILYMPSGNPPHKTHRTDGATDNQRREMTALAIKGNPHFRLDIEEMERTGFTYTNETLRMLKEAHPENEYYFIIGADSLMSFDTWKNPDIICKYCVLLAAVREQTDLEHMEIKAEELRKKYNAQIFFLHFPTMDISSTEIRKRQREGKSIRYFLPDTVVDYIQKNQIYKSEQM